MLGDPPLVSVVIPVFNRADCIGRAIESVLGQDYAPLELIIVDDASTDDLDSSLEKFSDPRLRLIRHEIQKGAGAARNTGIRAARGTLIAFLDSDDWWAASKLKVQVEALAAAPAEVSALVTAYRIRRDGGDFEDKYPAGSEFDCRKHLVWGCNLGPGSTLLARRAVFDRIGYFDESYERLEDWDWLLRYARSYRLGLVPQLLAYVDVTGTPAYEPVRRALKQLHRSQLPMVREWGLTAVCKFRSSVNMELAAAAWKSGHYGVFWWAIMKTMVLWPFRDRSFYRRGVGMLAGACRSLFGTPTGHTR